MPKAAKPKLPKLHSYRYFVLNIKIRTVRSTDDLAPNEYARIFKDFYQSFVVGKSSRQKECMLITQGEREVNTERIFFGQFAQVTILNNKKWFNRKTKEIDASFKVSPDYAANAAITEYFFFPSIHRFVYLVKTANFIQPYSAKSYFKNALKKHLSDEYIVDVDVESDLSTIARIRDAPELIRLEVRINYSNNDFAKELQEFVEDDMKASNIGEMQIKAVQKEGHSIDVSKSKILGGALEASRSNGEADATIKDAQGKKHKLSTSDNPLKMTIKATSDSKIETLYNDVTNEFRQK